MNEQVTIRDAESKDVEAMMTLIKELAVYEKALDEVTLSAERLRLDGFGASQYYRSLIAEINGDVVGMALFYPRYSTWKGMTLYLEDLVVGEQFRRRGIGSRLLEELIRIADQEGAERLEWQVLDWNESAIDFYRKYHTSFDGEWLNCRLTRRDIERIAQG